MSRLTLNKIFLLVTIFFINLKLGNSSRDLFQSIIRLAKGGPNRANNELDPIKYLLFGRRANNWAYMPQDLKLWKKDGELKVIIHGFNPLTFLTGIAALKAQNILILGQEYARHNSSINVVVVDWIPWATKQLSQYSIAAGNTRRAAANIASKLIIWKNRGLFKDWKFLHIIGFSLGAHTAGMVGNRIQQATGAKVGRITGLDPAGPGFDIANGQAPDDLSGFLDKNDAEFVDIVHCNMGTGGQVRAGLQGTFGSVVRAGHVDFYPNGGSRQSHVCTVNKDRFGCSHQYCVLLMADSVRNKNGFPACPCKNWNQFTSGRCGCINGDYSNALYMGDAGNTLGMQASRGYYGLVQKKLTSESFY